MLRGLHYCYTCVVDLLLTSSSPEEHKYHLHLVLELLEDHSILINPATCVFGASQLEFSSQHVDSTGICPLEEKVQAICDFPQPTTLRKLREFLGLVKISSSLIVPPFFNFQVLFCLPPKAAPRLRIGPPLP